MASKAKVEPKVAWDGEGWHVTLPLQQGQVVEAKWKPLHIWVIRIREADCDDWGYGIETPIMSCRFVNLKPDTDYEFEVRLRDGGSGAEPIRKRFRTTSQKAEERKILPFPKPDSDDRN